MSRSTGPEVTGGTSRYQVRLAQNDNEIDAAGRLRYDVFELEMGAHTPGPDGIDRDDFDGVADHLIVWSREPHQPQRPVATYRLLAPHANTATPAERGLYSWTEFDLTPLAGLMGTTVEAGRACVDADHRTSTPIALLWGGIARYMHLTGYRYLIGCASIPLHDNGAQAAAFEIMARQQHWTTPERECRPRLPFLSWGIEPAATVEVPPLLRAYLRLGATICGRPAYDPAFNTADFLLLLDLHAADQRYLQHFRQFGTRA